MRTVLLILAGAALATLLWRLLPASRRPVAPLCFMLLWLAACAWNLNTGLSHGYTLAQELPIHAVLFGLPTLLSWALWWKAPR